MTQQDAVNGFMDAWATNDHGELLHHHWEQMCLLFGRYCEPYISSCPCTGCTNQPLEDASLRRPCPPFDPPSLVAVLETLDTSIKPGDRLKLTADHADSSKIYVTVATGADVCIGVALEASHRGWVTVCYYNTLFVAVEAAPGSNIKIGDHLKTVQRSPGDNALMLLVTTASEGEAYGYIAWSIPVNQLLSAKVV